MSMITVAPSTSLDELLALARRIRAERSGTRITYSPKVFIPLTMLCSDHCGYCTFAKPPAKLASAYLDPDQVLEIARAGAAGGCRTPTPARCRPTSWPGSARSPRARA